METLMQGFRALKMTGQLSAFWLLLVPLLAVAILAAQILGKSSLAAVRKLLRNCHAGRFS
jgi:hypothetical protein